MNKILSTRIRLQENNITETVLRWAILRVARDATLELLLLGKYSAFRCSTPNYYYGTAYANRNKSLDTARWPSRSVTKKKKRTKDRKEYLYGVNRSVALISLFATKKKLFRPPILLGDFVLKVVLFPLENVDPLMILVQNGLHASC